MTGATANTSSRPAPQTSDEICNLDTCSHHMMFWTALLDHETVTFGY
jgi:hypothetical protein